MDTGLRLKGTLLGIGASLGGVVLWVIFYFVGIIAGIAGALMGVLFILVYTKINAGDKSKYPYIVGGALIIVEIFIAELISLAIEASVYEVSFAEALAVPEIQSMIVLDIILGFVLSGLVFFYYIFSIRKKAKLGEAQAAAQAAALQAKQANEAVSETADSDPFAEQTLSDGLNSVADPFEADSTVKAE